MDSERLKTISELTLQLAALLGTDKIDFAKIREGEALSLLSKELIAQKSYCTMFSITGSTIWPNDRLNYLDRFQMISKIESFVPIFNKFCDLNFIIIPGEGTYCQDSYSTLSSCHYPYKIETLANFRANSYWKFFEGENEELPKTKAFILDSGIKNVYYPNYWPLFKKMETDDEMRNLIINSVLRNAK